MTVSRIYPETQRLPGSHAQLEAALTQAYLPDTQQFFRLNLVSSLNGSFAGADGLSDSLSNPHDRLLLAVIRKTADVVLVGGKTAQLEGYANTSGPPLAIISQTGELSKAPFTPGHPLYVLVPPGVEPRLPSGVECETVSVDALDDGLDVEACSRVLQSRGMHRIVCEGGPTLATRALEANLVTEVCLTMTTIFVRDTIESWINPNRDVPLVLSSLLFDDEYAAFYSRWLPRLPSSTP